MAKLFRMGFGMRQVRCAHAVHSVEKITPLMNRELSALLSPHSLRLQSLIPSECMASIRQLPEIQTALNARSATNLRLQNGNAHFGILLKPIHETILDIQRAIEIFAQFALGGREHLASLLLQVDFLNDSGSPQEASDKLKEYIVLQKAKNCLLLDPVHLLVAQSKLEWMNGRFDVAIEYAQNASDESVSIKSNDAVLKQTMALNAQALSRMTQIDFYSKQIEMSTIVKMEDILGTFKIASQISSNEFRLVGKSTRRRETLLATAIALCNQGVAELLFIFSKNNKTLLATTVSSSLNIPIDPAMTAWRQAISYLESTEEKTDLDQDQLLVDLLRAKIYSNMSHALLFSSYTSITDYRSTITDTDLKKASEFASLAIKIYNNVIASTMYIASDFSTIQKVKLDSPVALNGIHISCFLQQDLARALTLAAYCYAKSGSAVTAQGLFQSSIDILDSSQGRYPWPLTALDARTTCLGYADLCRQWEKRDTDYRLYSEKAEKIENSLQPTWKNKAGILSGVCFYC